MNINTINEHISYDPETGDLRWKKDKGTATAGDLISCKNSYGYVVFKINGKMIFAHRAAWLIVNGEVPDQIDHINGIRDDNRISNLRNVSHKENGKNQRTPKRSSTGISGVTWDKERSLWGVRILAQGKRLRIGRFSTLIDAVAARIRALKLHGYHENHGR